VWRQDGRVYERSRVDGELAGLVEGWLKRAAELIHGLVTPLPKGASVEDLLRVAGTLDDQAAREMMQAIEEGCEP
jgi:hypothetical protein